MNTVQTIGRGVAWNTISTIVGKVVIFANVFLILHYLSVYEYGLSELVLSVVSTMSIVLLPGLSSAITSDLAVERGRNELGRMKSIFIQFLSINVLLSVFAWAVLFFGSSFAAHLAGNDSIGYFLKIISFTFLISPWRGVANMLATVEIRFFDQSFYSVFEEIAKGLCLIFFFYILHQTISGLLFASVISQLIAFIIYIPRTFSAYRYFSRAEAKDGYIFWQILRQHRKWSIVVTYIGSMGKTIQLWIIRFLLGTEAVGLYSFATGVIGQITSFLPFNNVLVSILPRFVDLKNEFLRIFKSSIKAQFIFSIGLIALSFIGAPILFWVFPKYNPAFTLLYISFLAIIPCGIVSMYTPAFNTLKEQYAFFYSMIWKIVFSSIFLWPCIILFGIPGMGVAMVLGFISSMIERTIRLRSLIPGFSLSLTELFRLDSTEIDLFKKFFGDIRSRGIFSIFK